MVNCIKIIKIYLISFKEVQKMEDKTIVCKDCGKEFVFTVGEQEFYKEKGFENDPVRCPDCRKARKAQKMNRERR
jgi:ssDNA-binding Zn-finger/Zn-ribbon topoisomerase 1